MINDPFLTLDENHDEDEPFSSVLVTHGTTIISANHYGCNSPTVLHHNAYVVNSKRELFCSYVIGS